MITKRLHIQHDGIDISVKVRYSLVDWSSLQVFELLGLEHPIWFTQYDAHKQAALVDVDSPNWYTDLAALSEHLYADPDFADLTSDIRDDEHRYADIERYVVSVAGGKREDYIEARLTTFRDILNKNAYFQHSKEEIECAVSELNSLRVV